MSETAGFGTFTFSATIGLEETVTVDDIGFGKEDWEELDEEDRKDNLQGYFLELIHATVEELKVEGYAKGETPWEDPDNEEKDDDDEEEEDEEEEDEDNETPLAMLDDLIDQGLEFPEALHKVRRRFPYANPAELTDDYDQISQMGL
jgi:TATA-binding protein-associated factor Taf7